MIDGFGWMKFVFCDIVYVVLIEDSGFKFEE